MFCLAGCGAALPVGIAPTDGSADVCRASYDGLNVNSRGQIIQDRDTLSDEDRKRCRQFYNEAERQRREALSQDLEEHMSLIQPESEDELTESSIVIRQDSTEFD